MNFSENFLVLQKTKTGNIFNSELPNRDNSLQCPILKNLNYSDEIFKVISYINWCLADDLVFKFRGKYHAYRKTYIYVILFEDMKRMFKNIVMGLAIILFLNSCNSSTEPIPTPLEYPTNLFSIGRVKADSIQNSIRSNDFFSYIDEYGLFSFSGTLGRG